MTWVGWVSIAFPAARVARVIEVTIQKSIEFVSTEGLQATPTIYLDSRLFVTFRCNWCRFLLPILDHSLDIMLSIAHEDRKNRYDWRTNAHGRKVGSPSHQKYILKGMRQNTEIQPQFVVEVLFPGLSILSITCFHLPTYSSSCCLSCSLTTSRAIPPTSSSPSSVRLGFQTHKGNAMVGRSASPRTDLKGSTTRLKPAAAWG
jgi:hypothetical protein